MAQLKKLPGLTAVVARDIVSIREKILFNRPIEHLDFEKIPIVQQLCESGHLVLRAEGASSNTQPNDSDEIGDRLEQLENRFCRLEGRVESLASVSDRERQSSNVRLDGMQTSLNSILAALQKAGIGASPRNDNLETIDPPSEHQVVNTNVRSVSPSHSAIAQGGYSNTLGPRYYAPGSRQGGSASNSGPTAYESPPVPWKRANPPKPERTGPSARNPVLVASMGTEIVGVTNETLSVSDSTYLPSWLRNVQVADSLLESTESHQPASAISSNNSLGSPLEPDGYFNELHYSDYADNPLGSLLVLTGEPAVEMFSGSGNETNSVEVVGSPTCCCVGCGTEPLGSCHSVISTSRGEADTPVFRRSDTGHKTASNDVDFQVANEVVIDLRRRRLSVRGMDIPFLLQGNESACVSQVYLGRGCTFPPSTGVIVPIRLSHCLSDELVLVPRSFSNGLLIPEALINTSKGLDILVLNPTSRHISIPFHTIIGSAYDLDSPVWPLPHRALASPRVCSLSISDNVDPSSLVPEHLRDLYDRSCVRLSNSEADQLGNLLVKFQGVFAKHDMDLGCMPDIVHRIDTGESKSFREGMRRTPLGFEMKEEKNLKNMLDLGVIRPSTSEFASAPVGVRWCIDLRRLNEITVKDAFPLPLMDECLSILSGCEYFSTLDMASGYWQIRIAEDNCKKTAFTTK